MAHLLTCACPCLPWPWGGWLGNFSFLGHRNLPEAQSTEWSWTPAHSKCQGLLQSPPPYPSLGGRSSPTSC